MTIEEQLKEIVEKTQITDLLIRYFAAVDDKCIDMEIVKATLFMKFLVQFPISELFVNLPTNYKVIE